MGFAIRPIRVRAWALPPDPVPGAVVGLAGGPVENVAHVGLDMGVPGGYAVEHDQSASGQWRPAPSLNVSVYYPFAD